MIDFDRYAKRCFGDDFSAHKLSDDEQFMDGKLMKYVLKQGERTVWAFHTSGEFLTFLDGVDYVKTILRLPAYIGINL